MVDWWVSVPGAVKGQYQYSDLFPGWHVANESVKPQVCINSNNSAIVCKNLQPEMEICNRK